MERMIILAMRAAAVVGLVFLSGVGTLNGGLTNLSVVMASSTNGDLDSVLDCRNQIIDLFEQKIVALGSWEPNYTIPDDKNKYFFRLMTSMREAIDQL